MPKSLRKFVSKQNKNQTLKKTILERFHLRKILQKGRVQKSDIDTFLSFFIH